MTEKDLLAKKKEIQTAKSELAELKGEQNVLTRQLKSEWGCTTLPQAKKKIQKFENQIKELDSSISKATNGLEEKYFKEEEEA